MSADDKVRFLVGGVQKGGTTALFRYLADLPQLSMAVEKETHFFDDEVNVDWAAPDYGRFHAMFPPRDGRPRGEATPIYLYWPHCLERIARYNPNIRLIFIFRDPVERAWSHWRMEYARGWETEPFAWAIREGRARVDSPEAPGCHRVFSYVERGFYAAQLRQVYRLFDPGQILLLASEALKHAPDETLARVCRFVGAPPPDRPVGQRRELEGKDMDYGSLLTEADRTYLRDLYAEDQAAFTAISGLELGEPVAASGS